MGKWFFFMVQLACRRGEVVREVYLRDDISPEAFEGADQVLILEALAMFLLVKYGEMVV